jgi:hypothetical protein
MKGVKKQHLPEKVCLKCGRNFTWRKKWEKVWEEVKYCSKKCGNISQVGKHNSPLTEIKKRYPESIQKIAVDICEGVSLQDLLKVADFLGLHEK